MKGLVHIEEKAPLQFLEKIIILHSKLYFILIIYTFSFISSFLDNKEVCNHSHI